MWQEDLVLFKFVKKNQKTVRKSVGKNETLRQSAFSRNLLPTTMSPKQVGLKAATLKLTKPQVNVLNFRRFLFPQFRF